MSAEHVVPRNDLIQHEDTDDCPCGPRSEPIKRDDGSVGWVIVHHSLDGREVSNEASGCENPALPSVRRAGAAHQFANGTGAVCWCGWQHWRGTKAPR